MWNCTTGAFISNDYANNNNALNTQGVCTFNVFQIDYFERAKRLEEIPMIKKAYEEQRIKDMELWELQEEERVTPYSLSRQSAQMKRCSSAFL